MFCLLQETSPSETRFGAGRAFLSETKSTFVEAYLPVVLNLRLDMQSSPGRYSWELRESRNSPMFDRGWMGLIFAQSLLSQTPVNCQTGNRSIYNYHTRNTSVPPAEVPCKIFVWSSFRLENLEQSSSLIFNPLTLIIYGSRILMTNLYQWFVQFLYRHEGIPW